MITWLQFMLCTAVIVYAGTKLSKYGDIIAEKTGLGRTWVGVVLLASVTSLPELITGVSSVAVFDLPNIAAGDVLGSCLFNILILALLDLVSGTAPLSTRAHQGQILSAGFGVILLGLVSLCIYAGPVVPSVGWVGLYSPVFIGIYFLAMRTVFLYEKRRIAEFIDERAEKAGPEAVSKKKAYLAYGVNAAVIIAAAAYLPRLGSQIAAMTGLSRGFVGSVFIALSTSLPELVVSIASLRIGAVDMVFGNIFGSNLFNIAILALDDILYTKGPILSHVSGNLAIVAVGAMILTAIAVVGLTFRTSKKRLFLGWDSLAILAIYALTAILLYVSGAPSGG